MNEKCILNLIVQNPEVIREKMVIEAKLSDSTISRILKQLQEKNIIRREGSRKKESGLYADSLNIKKYIEMQN